MELLRTTPTRTASALVTALVLAALAGCGAPTGGTQDSSTERDLSEHEDVTWVLVSGTVDGETVPVPIATPITVRFERRVGLVQLVAQACNALVGELAGWPDVLAVESLSQSEMGCEDVDLMASESALSTALPRLDAVSRDGDTLSLAGPDVELELVSEGAAPGTDDGSLTPGALDPGVLAALTALDGREWELVSGTVDGQAIGPVDDVLITLATRVDDDGVLQVGGRACNSWGITLDGSAGDEVTSTAMLCGDDLMAVEAAVQRAVTHPTSVAAEAGALTLLGDGVELLWSERPPLDLATLQDVTWSMETLTVGGAATDVPPGTTWTLSSDGTMLATSTCLVLRSEWVSTGSDVMPTTSQQDGLCGEDDMAAGGTALAALGDGFSATLTDGLLTTVSRFGAVATHTPAPVPVPVP